MGVAATIVAVVVLLRALGAATAAALARRVILRIVALWFMCSWLMELEEVSSLLELQSRILQPAVGGRYSPRVVLVSDEQRARTHAPLQQVHALRLGARLQLAAMVAPRG